MVLGFGVKMSKIHTIVKDMIGKNQLLKPCPKCGSYDIKALNQLNHKFTSGCNICGKQFEDPTLR